MIGLEYILEIFNVQQKDIAEELGIKKQNINLWIKGKQKISQKYLPVLSKKFNIPVEYFQKELTELDKKFIEKKQLDEHIEKTSFEYEEEVWDDASRESVTIKRMHYDTGAIDHYRMLEAEEKEIRAINKIKSTINDVEEAESIDEHIGKYEKNIKLFERYADIVNTQGLDKGLIEEVLDVLEVCIPVIAQNSIWERESTEEDKVIVANRITQEICEAVKMHATKREQEIKETEWIEKNFPADADDFN